MLRTLSILIPWNSMLKLRQIDATPSIPMPWSQPQALLNLFAVCVNFLSKTPCNSL